jgi:hypothetical protein
MGQEENIGEKIDQLTYAWDRESVVMEDYEGMVKFCSQQEYRYEVIQLLKDIHHYDSVLYDRLSKANRFSQNKEIERTLKDIAAFEEEYSMTEFIQYLYDECQLIYELETNREELENDITYESYSGRRYLIETELGKYIRHIRKRVDVIREHVHHLHIK